MYRYEVRFNLGLGQNYMKWKVTDRLKGKVHYLLPDEQQIRLNDCRLVNRKSQAQKIFEGAHKQVCAFVECRSFDILNRPVPLCRHVLYNPRIAPYWRDVGGRDIDGMVFKTLMTNGRVVYER